MIKIKAKQNTDECLLCHAPLEYFAQTKSMPCMLCQKQEETLVCCEKGHFICDDCHRADALQVIEHYCKQSESKDPVAMLKDLFRFPQVHMHGPEHHVLVGAVLLTAFHNAGMGLDLDRAMSEMIRRGKEIPGGVCGMWGSCGAAISAGIFMSIITDNSPLATSSWKMSNRLTGECLIAVAELGGPRCCKRDAFTVILHSVDYLKKHMGIQLETSEAVICEWCERNRQCLRKACPYYKQEA